MAIDLLDAIQILESNFGETVELRIHPSNDGYRIALSVFYRGKMRVRPVLVSRSELRSDRPDALEMRLTDTMHELKNHLERLKNQPEEKESVL